MTIIKAIRGMNDLFEPEISKWHFLEEKFRKVFDIYGYEEIRTPILEDILLFKRGVGENTDIVEKEMFLIKDGEHEYCLRPENTAPLVRALIERGDISPEYFEKFFYIGPMFRKERPQKGRLRQFHQFGIECFGINEPTADVEIITMVDHLFSLLKLKGIKLKINSLGQKEERSIYKNYLYDYFRNYLTQLCEDCKRRINTNILRILDCKKEGCQKVCKNAPKSLDFLSASSKEHFFSVLNGLKEENIDYEIESSLVRGLDYYERTVFEFVADNGLGSQNAVAAGGRYDGLFSTLGYKSDVSAIGCAGGIERIVLLLNSEEDIVNGPKIALIAADDDGFSFIPSLAFYLRKSEIKTDFCLNKRSLKAQMRRANKIHAQNVLVIGKNEIEKKEAILKNFNTNQQSAVKLDVDSIKNAL